MSSQKNNPGKKFRVLIIEDFLEWGETLADTLNEIEGVEITLVTSVAEAYKKINAAIHDLAICDLRLIDSDLDDRTGINFISYLKKRFPNIDVIVLSGYLTPQIAKELFELNVYEIISKIEYSSKLMIEKVKRCLRDRDSKNIVTSSDIPSELVQQLSIQGQETLLEDIIHAFLHNLNNHAALSRTAIDNLSNLLLQNNSVRVHDAQKELYILSEAIKNISKISRRFRNIIGRVPTLYKPINVNHLIDEILISLNIPKNVNLRRKFFKKLPLVEADKELFWHLFENLISNALDAVEGNLRAEITVTTRSSRDGSDIYVVVSDNGIGIHADLLPHIYEISFSTKPRGLGIGLYLVKRSVDIHRGKIKCQSTPGKGTQFEISLPVRRSSE